MIPEEVFGPGASPPLTVELLCEGCTTRFSRKFDWALVSAEPARYSSGWDGILLSDVVTCPKCGAVDVYTIAAESKFALTGRLLLSAAKGGKPDRVAIGVSQLWDGTIVYRPTQALARLRSLAETHPQSAKAFRCLGNACSRWQRMDEALASWRKACDLDDDEVEAALSLAGQLLQTQENVAEGFFYLRRAIAALPTAVSAAAVSGYIVRGTFRLLSSFLERCEDDVALMAAWPSGEYRNEPVVTMSAVDMRKVRDFERLADLVEAGHFNALGLTPDLPDENETTNLERLLANDTPREIPPRRFDEIFPHAARHLQFSAPVSEKSAGRNAPCPCGSGRKYKRCCARTRR